MIRIEDAVVWWYSVVPGSLEPGTVIVEWPDGGKTVRNYSEYIEGGNSWYSRDSNGNYFIATADHSMKCEQLLQQEITRRNQR